MDNKPTFSLKELLICTALIVIGCVIFANMPEKMGILGWGMFAIGTFLSIIGIFRLAAMMPEDKNDPIRKMASIVALIAAVVIQTVGLLYLYNSDGTGKGIAITTLTLCISLGLIIYVVDFEDETKKNTIKIICRIITVVLVAIAVFLIFRNDFAGPSIYVGTILAIEAVIAGKIGFASRK